MKRYTKQHARRSLFHTAAFRAVSQLATFASFAVLVRSMSEHEFGILQLLYAVIPVISTVFSLGIEQTLRRYQPEYLQAGQLQVAAWLLRVASRSRLAANLLVLGIILAFWSWLAPFFHLAPYRTEFSVFCLLILMHFQVSILQLALSSHMLQAYSVGGTVVLAVTKLLAYLLLQHFGHLNLTNAIFADMAGYALMYVLLRVAHVRHCVPASDGKRFQIDPQERRRLMRYSLYNNFNDAGTLLLTSKTDNFFLAAMLSPVAVGAYSMYGRLSEMTSQLLPIRQFSNVIQPLFFSVPREQATQKLPRYFTFMMNSTLALQFPILVMALACHADIVSLFFKSKFLDYSWLLPLVVAFSTANRIADPVTLVAQYDEKTHVILASKLFGIVNAALLLVLIPPLGVYGAAIATGASQLIKNLVVWWYVRDKARWTNFTNAAVGSVLLWASALGVCLGLKKLFGMPPAASIACGLAVCALALLVHLRSSLIAKSDRQILTSLFHGREARLLKWLGVL